ARLGEDALVAGGVARGQVADGAQQVGDGVPAGGQDGGERQQGEAAVGGLGEGGGEFLEQQQGGSGYTLHWGLLARASGVVVPPPRIPARRPVYLPLGRSQIAPKSAEVELSSTCAHFSQQLTKKPASL